MTPVKYRTRRRVTAERTVAVSGRAGDFYARGDEARILWHLWQPEAEPEPFPRGWLWVAAGVVVLFLGLLWSVGHG